MDVSERLTTEDLRQPGYLAASHLHRYTLAASLCVGLRVLDVGCGTGYGTALIAERAASVRGVDIDGPTVEQAAAQHPEAGFEAVDGVQALRMTAGHDVDVVVMFEALEHVADPGAVLAELRRLRADGVRLLVSVPNSVAFREANPFHVTNFGWTDARRAFEDLDGTLLRQYLTEGSLVLAPEGTTQLAGEVVTVERAEPEYANAFICAAGFDTDAVQRATTWMNVVAAPSHNRYMLDLERANAELFAVNRQLARGAFGKHDAAAATMVAKFERRLEEQERHIASQIAQIGRLSTDVANLTDDLTRERAWRDAPRYHLMDRLADAIRSVPVISQLARGIWWFARRAFKTRR